MSLPTYLTQYPAWFHLRILVGAGAMLTEEFVEKHKITHVINCSVDKHSPEWFRQKYPERYAVINAIDSYETNIIDWYYLFKDAMWKFLTDVNSKNIFVHCQCGINRAPFLTMMYVCDNFDMDYDEVLKMTYRQRKCMYTNLVYRNQTELFIKYGGIQD
jgi:protein tyrosine phosphatase